jgi:hypothetical protein
VHERRKTFYLAFMPQVVIKLVCLPRLKCECLKMYHLRHKALYFKTQASDGSVSRYIYDMSVHNTSCIVELCAQPRASCRSHPFLKKQIRALETGCWMDVITSSTINQYNSSGPHAHDCLNNHEVKSTQELLKHVSLGLTISFCILSHLACAVTQSFPRRIKQGQEFCGHLS